MYFAKILKAQLLREAGDVLTHRQYEKADDFVKKLYPDDLNRFQEFEIFSAPDENSAVQGMAAEITRAAFMAGNGQAVPFIHLTIKVAEIPKGLFWSTNMLDNSQTRGVMLSAPQEKVQQPKS